MLVITDRSGFFNALNQLDELRQQAETIQQQAGELAEKLEEIQAAIFGATEERGE